ncbi:AraC family transcriptional regulator [Paenibacillus sp. 32352]|uniref:AraC family transcriptional regulator n=1 Tax=Paenibacillus sp. 32352 TaxID=1969111 RepID=UPI0009ADA804|nr:AraC family transcriptional regulator [Paenibacillus sp. 32352]
MASGTETGTFGFRFKVPTNLSMCELFAVGRDVVRDTSYCWGGLERTDGPLLLFQYTLEGEGIYENGGNTYRIEAGRAFMAEIPGNHRYYFPEDSSCWSFIFVLLRPSLILPNWEEAIRRLGETPYLQQTSRPIRFLEHIWEEANAGRITEPYTASSYMYQFVSELCRLASAPDGEGQKWPVKIKEAAAFLESHYDRMISLDQLSEQLGLSKYHLLRTFTATVGISPNDYLNRVRIEQAMRLLHQTDWSVEEIAERVGYSSGSYFIKVFRKVTGRTPGSFRSGEGQLTFNRMFFD